MDTITDAPSETKRKPGLLINGSFARLWAGQAISMMGDWLFDTTLILWIASDLGRGQSWAPLAVSGVLVTTSLPFLLVGPFAGVFVDRWDKRQTMLRMDAIRAVLIAALLLATGILPLPFFPGGQLPLAGKLGVIYLTVFLTSLCAQFFRPSQTALIGDLVSERYRVRASGLSEMTANLALVIGPALASPLFLAFGAAWALLIDALSFVVSLLTLWSLRPPAAAHSIAEGERGHFLREFREGLRFYFKDRILTTLLISFVVVMLGGGAFNALAVFFVTDNLHASAASYGYAAAVVGLGLVVGALLGSMIAERVGLTRLFWIALLAVGASALGLARMTSIGPGLVLYFIFGLAQGPLNVSVMPLLLHVTPRELVGRVSAVLEPAMMMASVASMVVVGVLDSTALKGFHLLVLDMRFGPVDTIYTVVALLMLVAGVYAMLSLRGIRVVADSSLARGAEGISTAHQ